MLNIKKLFLRELNRNFNKEDNWKAKTSDTIKVGTAIKIMESLVCQLEPLVSKGEASEPVQIAKNIVEELFVNGDNKKAKRLILELEDNNSGGGWGKKPMIDIIVKHLSNLSA